jgi:hypothetical protein
MPPCAADAGWLVHAAKRAVAKKIVKKGFSPKRMSRKARFGKGTYLSKSKKTALKEKPDADAVVVVKNTRSLKKNNINLNDASKKKIKAISGDNDLRGNIHNGIIGPDLGRKIGRKAGKSGKIVTYKSAKDSSGTNIFIPSELYKRNPRIVKPVKVIEYGR